MGKIGEKCGNILLNLVELWNRVMGKYISIMYSTLLVRNMASGRSKMNW